MKLIIKTDQTCIKCTKGMYVRTKVTPTSWEFKCNHCGHTEYRYDQSVAIYKENGSTTNGNGKKVS